MNTIPKEIVNALAWRHYKLETKTRKQITRMIWASRKKQLDSKQ